MSNLLNLGVSGIKAQQSLLNTVSHNIANASTEGYSRQTTELQPKSPVKIGNVLIGSGVQTAATKRVVDDLLVKLHRDNVTNTESLSVKEDLLTRINTLVADADTGVSKAFSSFYQAMQAASTKPEATETRTSLLAEAEKFVKRLNILDDRFDRQTRDINEQMRSVATRVNDIADSLAKLNTDIMNTSNQGEFINPNDLLDQRDKLLLELSGLIGTTTVEQGDGSINVFIGNGQSLVVGGIASVIDTVNNPDDPSKLDVRSISQSSVFTITDVLSGGKMGGLIEAQKILEPTRATLGRIALTMAMTFNAQHKLGVDLNGDLGENFFNNPNSISAQLNRVVPSGYNKGNAVLGVTVNEIPRPDPGPFQVFGQPSAIVNASTLTQLNAGELIINGQSISPAVGDGVSSTDADASALAFANAINNAVGLTGVTAKAEVNALHLGAFTTGAYIAGEFQINGTNIVTTGTDETTLLRDINAMTATTGVRAVGDGNLNITLYADDGRNIQLTSNTNTPAATFTHFDTNSGTALDRVQRSSISITSIDPGTKIVISGGAPGDVGLSVGTTPADTTSLTDSDYLMTYDGTNYTLTRQSDNAIMGTNTTPTFNVDGFTVSLNNGTVTSGDRFIIRPTLAASKDFALGIKEISKIALASPISVTPATSNSVTGNDIKRVRVIDTSGSPVSTSTVLGNAFQVKKQLTPPIRIEFFNDLQGNPTVYRVFDIANGLPGNQIGPDQTFVPNQDNEIFPISSVIDATAPGPNVPVVYDPGYRVTIAGAPNAGDVFNVSYNLDGKGDSANVKEFIKMKDENLLDSGSSTYLGTYNSLVTTIGSQTQSTQANKDAAVALERQSNARIQGISGVNLDEEAAKLIRFQQAFRAAAQVIAAGSNLFDSVISAVRG